MEAEAFQRIAFECSGRVLRVTLCGCGSVNAVDGVMHEELARLFPALQRDPESDIVVLTGRGESFCAGGDMRWFEEMIERPAKFRALAPEAKRIIHGLLELEKPIICRLNGSAAGLGASIALLCDVIVAAEAARIGDPHVKVGLVAGDGGAVIWPQLVGFARAKELLLTGDMLEARDALAMGLVNHVVPAGQLDAKVEEIVAKIQRNPRWAVRWTKTCVNIALRDLANKISDAAIAYEVLSNLMEDRREAVRAFAEKRAPRLTGE